MTGDVTPPIEPARTTQARDANRAPETSARGFMGAPHLRAERPDREVSGGGCQETPRQVR